MASIPDLIRKKRDGGALSDEEIRFFVHAVATDAIEDCQTGTPPGATPPGATPRLTRRFPQAPC